MMTIQELQAFIDTKPDLRQIINKLADYIQEHPEGGEGGSGNTIYTADDALVSDRTVDLNGKVLQFMQGGEEFLKIDPVGFQSQLYAKGATSSAGYAVTADSTNSTVIFEANASANGNLVIINGNAQANTIEYTAATHTFTGKIIDTTIVAKNFADDAAAAIGGVELGEDYHTDGVKKVRII